MLPGFNSQIFVAPDDGVGVMAFTNGARGAMLWLPAETGELLGGVLDVPAATIRTDVPHHPESWADICGWYALDAGPTDARARLMLGAGAEVFIRGGQPVVRVVSPIPALYRGFTLHPDDPADPDVYRIDLSSYGISTARVIFSRDEARAVTGICLEVMPMSLRRRPDRTNPRIWTTIAVDVLAGLVLGKAAMSLFGRRGPGGSKEHDATDRPRR